MKIPRSVTVNTGEQGEVYKSIDQFLLEAKSEIEKKVGKKYGPSEFRTEIKGLCKLVRGEPLPGNEFAHLLYYKEKVAATVLETRTEMNYIHFNFGYFFDSS
jgi:hypothetical protein